MTNGVFKSSDKFSHARAQDVMSTQSSIGFEWSVKLIGDCDVHVGIASKIKKEERGICSYDSNSVLYSTFYSDIRVGSNTLHSNLTEHKDGDVIRFRFKPQTKKLLIELVRLNLLISA